MITPAYVRLMARHNAWQNRSILSAADALTDDARKQDRQAFWASIHATLNHILWGDQIWMSRFAGTPAPSAMNTPLSERDVLNWEGYKSARFQFDETIEAWADALTEVQLAGDLTWYSGFAKRDVTRAKWLLITHFFNHQTHHRGQVHCMLTQAGARPDDTDIPMIPADLRLADLMPE